MSTLSSQTLPHKTADEKMQQALQQRKELHMLRSLQVNEGLIDFCSNDYISFARSEKLKTKAAQLLRENNYLSGATGSRSISGNTAFAEELEKTIARFHDAEAGLLFNSGYDANVGLFSCIAAKGDTIICDELIHASIIDGCRLSHANRYRFKHNNLEDLKKKLALSAGTVFVAIESVYSMDGDAPDLSAISALCEEYGAHLIVDEAHATGISGDMGKGWVNAYGLEKNVFARVHTFGKALGGHGAIVLGNHTLRNYLINFARSFIFTTALPPVSLAHIAAAYSLLEENNGNASLLENLIHLFKKNFTAHGGAYLIESKSPIQSVVIGGAEKTRNVANYLQQQGFDVRAILSPSVPAGKERLRISLHLHNTPEQIEELITHLSDSLQI